jgi:hypothetical protein
VSTSGTVPLWFWLVAGSLVALVLWRAREHGQSRRENALRLAVAESTRELNREKLRKYERSCILEMLLSNEPLGTVLDAVVRLIRANAVRSLKRGP